MAEFVEGRTFHEAETEPMPGIEDKETRKKLGLREAPEPTDKETPKDGDKKELDVKVPEKYEGKSQEDLLKILVDRDKTVGDQGTRLKKIEDDLEFNRRMSEINRPAPETRREPPKKDEPKYKDDDFMSYKDVKKLVGDEVQKDREMKIVTDQEKLLNMVGLAHEEGKKSLAGNKMAEGIEKETEMAVFEHFKPWVEKGYDCSAYLRDSKTWDDAARGVRFRRKEYDYLVDKKEDKDTEDIEPVTPVEGQKPGGRTARTDYEVEPIRFNPHNKYVMEKFGLTEEEAETGLKDIRERRRRGEQV